MARRVLPDWIKSYMQFTENSESPVSFRLWSAVGCVAAALRRRVYMVRGHTKVYPNQYIIIGGKSGRTRKSEPVMVAQALAKAVGLNMLPEDITREALTRRLSQSVVTFSDGKRTLFECALAGFFEELSVFTGEQDRSFLATLTNWYDSRDDWGRETKNKGIDDAMGVCLTLVASTAPDWLPMILPKEAIGGGFTSRLLLVVEEEKGQILPEPPPPDEQLKKELIHDLEAIMTLVGEYTFDEGARRAYNKWYQLSEEATQAGNPPLKDPIFDGYVSRRSTHLRKVAIALAASRRNNLVITEADLEEALGMLEDLEKKMPRAFVGIGTAKYVAEADQVLSIVKTFGRISRSELLRRLHRSVGLWELQVVTSLLDQMKVIRIENVPLEREVYYEVPKKQISLVDPKRIPQL